MKFPRHISEVGITLTRFAVLCQCLFQGTGALHPFVEAMWRTAIGVQNVAPFISERVHALSRDPAIFLNYYARIVRAVQVGVYDYMQGVATNVAHGVVGIEIPNFTTMICDLKRGTFHNLSSWMELPAAYLEVPSTSSRTANTAPSAMATTTSQSSARSSVSSLTTELTAARLTRVENPGRDPEFEGITLRAGGTRNLSREHRPPANDGGQEMCVAWWTRGGCFPNCGRRSTHTPFASAGERSRLLTYVRTHLQAPASAAGSATSGT